MSKHVYRRHNKDGTVTTTTSYTRKNILGTRVTTSYSSRNSKTSGLSARFCITVIALLFGVPILTGIICLLVINEAKRQAFIRGVTIVAVIALLVFLLAEDFSRYWIFKGFRLLGFYIKKLINKIFKKQKSPVSGDEIQDTALENELIRRMTEYFKYDNKMKDAIDLCIQCHSDGVSIPQLHRELHIGYTQASRLMDSMQKLHVVSPYEGQKRRRVILTAKQLNAINETLQKELDRLNHAIERNEPKVDTAKEIQKFKQLLDSGAITQEEYDAKKRELLSK